MATKVRRATSKQIIRKMVRRIVERFAPEKVILFGSHVRGTTHAYSDVDLLVVMPVDGSRRAKAVEIAIALHDLGAPTDVIVSTPDAFEWRQNVPGTLERIATREGKVLHARC
ncbi:MAG TPA: nucleotidyltransferase domain-containing protein [Phycisphaerae bacterium]